MAIQLDEILATAMGQLEVQRKAVRLYGDYYDGKHEMNFVSDKFRTAFGTLIKSFADNLSPSIVDAVSDRLKLTGFQIDGGEEDDPIADRAWAIWKSNRMDRMSAAAHTEAIKIGDSFLVVWPRPLGKGTGIFINTSALMTVGYGDSDADDEAVPIWAVKMWELSDKQHRLNIYLPDRIEKYITRSSLSDGAASLKSVAQLDPFQVPGEPWPVPNPFGRVPVFHLANNAGISQWGRSELYDIVPLQNALNKSLIDLLVASEYYSLPQRWATGLDLDVDTDTGKVRPPFKSGVDTLWMADSDAKFGEFAQADLTRLVTVADSYRLEMARVSKTPLHYLIPGTGEFPSGESLKTAEAPFVAKIKSRQTAFGNTWEDALVFALLVEGLAVDSLESIWTSAEPRSEKEMLENAGLKKLAGVPKRQIWREMGYTEEQIDEFLAVEEEERASAGEAMMKAFDTGENF